MELLYRAIELDNLKAVEAKLREYEKPLFKEKASERKSSIMLNSSSMSKIKQTDHDHKLSTFLLTQNSTSSKTKSSPNTSKFISSAFHGPSMIKNMQSRKRKITKGTW